MIVVNNHHLLYSTTGCQGLGMLLGVSDTSVSDTFRLTLRYKVQSALINNTHLQLKLKTVKNAAVRQKLWF